MSNEKQIELTSLNTRITKRSNEKFNEIWDILQSDSELRISKQSVTDYIINKAYKKVLKEQKKKHKG